MTLCKTCGCNKSAHAFGGVCKRCPIMNKQCEEFKSE